MYVTVTVYRGARVLLRLTKHLCTEEYTFAQLLKEVCGHHEWPLNDECVENNFKCICALKM